MTTYKAGFPPRDPSLGLPAQVLEHNSAGRNQNSQEIRADHVSHDVFINEEDIQVDISHALKEAGRDIKQWGKNLIQTLSLSKPLEASEADGQSPPLKTMSKIEYLVRSFFAKFSTDAAEKLKVETDKHIQYRTDYADVSSNPGKLEKYEPSGDKAGEFLSIKDPKTQMINLDHREGLHTGHKEMAQYAATQKKLHENVKDTKIDGVGTLEPFCFETGKMVKGAVTPTSYLLGVDDKEQKDHLMVDSKNQKDHLMNVYVVKVGDTPVAQIRSGVIDTKQKADEFVALLKQIHQDFEKKNPGVPLKLRVVSHQLNSFDFGTEKKMINNQHRLIAYANQQLGEIADLVHINTPSNRFYHTTKLVRGFFESVWLGKVADFIEDYMLTGERLSKEQNLDSWATYTKWVAEDVDTAFNKLDDSLKKDPNLTRPLKDFHIEIDRCHKEISDLKTQIDKDLDEASRRGADVKVCEKRIQENRDKIRNLLNQEYTAIDAFAKQIEGNPKLEALSRPLELMRTVLGSQLDIQAWDKQPSRGQQLLSLQLLSQVLGVTVALNCKSGLDRTGLAFVLGITLMQMKEIPSTDKMSTDPFNMVRDWDRVTLALNKKMQEGSEEFEQWIQNDDGLSDDSGNIPKDQIRQVIEFRKMVLDNLIQVGLPITKTSTGIEGLKWSPGAMEENLVPLNFLPSHVMVGGELRPVVNYDADTGKPTGMAPTGQQLLTKFSGLRGS